MGIIPPGLSLHQLLSLLLPKVFSLSHSLMTFFAFERKDLEYCSDVNQIFWLFLHKDLVLFHIPFQGLDLAVGQLSELNSSCLYLSKSRFNDYIA